MQFYIFFRFINIENLVSTMRKSTANPSFWSVVQRNIDSLSANHYDSSGRFVKIHSSQISEHRNVSMPWINDKTNENTFSKTMSKWFANIELPKQRETNRQRLRTEKWFQHWDFMKRNWWIWFVDCWFFDVVLVR